MLSHLSVKILVFLTLLLPLIITSLILILINFETPGTEKYASSFSSLINVQASKKNPLIDDDVGARIVNAIWYILTLSGFILISITLFNLKDNRIVDSNN
jgi:hypothetical protein